MKNIVYVFLAVLFFACTDVVREESSGLLIKLADAYAVDTNHIIGSFEHEFPLITESVFLSVENEQGIADTERVFLLKQDSIILIFTEHALGIEAVNLKLPEYPTCITYCPITGSVIAFKSVLDSDTLLLRASGKRYRENVILKDENSGSLFSQMLFKGIHGEFKDRTLEIVPLVETTWEVAKNVHPKALVLQQFDTTHDLENCTVISFKSISSTSNRHSHIAFTGVDLSIYNLSNSTLESPISVNSNQSILFSRLSSYVVSYQIPSNGISKIENQLPIIFEDRKGNKYNWFGEVTEGPDIGLKLKGIKQYSAFHWAIEAFKPDFSLKKASP